jgi:hypothetical protein
MWVLPLAPPAIRRRGYRSGMADRTVGHSTSTDAVAAGVGLVAGGLALAPLITTVLALAAPVVRQELSSFDAGDAGVAGRELTLFGMIGQFDGLDSATGVVPIVILVVAALLVQGFAATTVLATTRSGSAGPFPWLPQVLMAAGVAVVLTTMLLVPVLSSADDVDNPRPAVDQPYGLTGPGWAYLMLAGVVAIATGALIRSTRTWLE